MAGIFSFQCSCCNEIHEGSPSFGYKAPDTYLQQSKEVQEAGFLNSDFCEYDDEDGTHYFIRVCLEIPIHGVEQPFLWGVWVSLSKQSFDRYVETYQSPDTSDQYFGWLCNLLPFYSKTFPMKTMVHPRAGKTRTRIVLEESDHALCIDFHNGISIQRAQEIAEIVMHR
jgi:hypothetical protein